MRPTPRRRSSRIRRAVALLAAVVSLMFTVEAVQTASAAETGLDGIGPGAPLLINRSDGSFGCTANFVFRSGSRRYIGTAGHCLVSKTDGTTATRVRVCAKSCAFGAFTNVANSLLNPLVELCGPSGSACDFPLVADGGSGNDFALIPVPSSLVGSLRAEVPVFGGPDGTATLAAGDLVCVYGNGLVAGETFASKGRPAVTVTAATSTRWFAEGVATEGDSGAPAVDCGSGAAVGVQNAIRCETGRTVPITAMCGTTIARALALGRSALGDPAFSLVEPS